MTAARTEALDSAGRILAAARIRQAMRTPREAAEAAYVPGGPSVAVLEERIRNRRNQGARLAS